MSRPEPAVQDRRKWLTRTVGGLIAVTLGALLYPIVRYVLPRRQSGAGASQVLAPYKVSDLRPDAEGRWPVPFNFGGRPCLLIKTPAGEVRAFDAICTHTDCTVEYRPDRKIIFCACHNGVYDLEGRNVSGPPPRPLEQHKVILRGKEGNEEITVSRSS